LPHGPSLQRRAWWQTTWGCAALALFCVLPLLWPSIPPLLDLPGHMVAYKLEIGGDQAAYGAQWYSLKWTLVGNLGINLLVLPMSKLFGLEFAVKLIVMAIPPLMAAGFLWVAYETHGRVPPTALFALPFVYSYPFIFGFLNFTLSMALCFIALALWIRLGRLGQFRRRAVVLVPLATLVWLAHAYGWGTLGVLVFAHEAARNRERGVGKIESVVRATLACLPLVLPVILSIVWRSGDVGGATTGWFAPVPKFNYILSALRDRWRWWDIASILLVLAVATSPAWSKRVTMAPGLAFGAFLLLILYLLLPQRIFGSSYADMRIMPFAIALTLLALRPPESAIQPLAIGGLAFLFLRIVAETASFAIYARSWDRELPALDHVPRGAKLISFVGTPCRPEWTMARLDHLPGLAAVRRDAFSNDQWGVLGAQLDQVSYAPAGAFGRDPSQIVRLHDCSVNRWPTLDMSLRQFPRAAFDYLWLINPPRWDTRLTAGMVPIWTNGRSVLFRIVDHSQPSGLPGDMLPSADR